VSPSLPSSPLKELARGAVWLVGLAAALQMVASALGQAPLAAALIGALIADLGGSRAGVGWPWHEREPGADDATRSGATQGGDARRRALRRIGLGAAAGALAAALTLGAALALGWARAEAGRPSLTLGLALLRAVAEAVRDEIVLTGVPFVAAARAGVAPPFAVVFAALAHGALVALVPDAGAAAAPLAITLGALSAALWWRHGGPWAAVAAVAAFDLLTGAGLRGALLDVTWDGATLSTSARASGPAAWLAAAILAGIALAVALRRPRRPRGAAAGPSL